VGKGLSDFLNLRSEMPYTIDCYVVMGFSQERYATPKVTTNITGCCPKHEMGRT